MATNQMIEREKERESGGKKKKKIAFAVNKASRRTSSNVRIPAVILGGFAGSSCSCLALKCLSMEEVLLLTYDSSVEQMRHFTCGEKKQRKNEKESFRPRVTNFFLQEEKTHQKKALPV